MKKKPIQVYEKDWKTIQEMKIKDGYGSAADVIAALLVGVKK